MGNQLKKVKRGLKKSASQIYYHPEPVYRQPAPPMAPVAPAVPVSPVVQVAPVSPVVPVVPVSPPVASVTVSLPPQHPPPTASVSVSIPPPMPLNHSYNSAQLPTISLPPPIFPPHGHHMPHHMGFGGMGISYIPGEWFPIDLPSINVGLGWDFKPGDRYDLDASVTGLDATCQIKESVYYSKKSGFNGAVRLSGDNTTGKGHGDDEIMYITLSNIPHYITTLAIAINSFRNNSLIRARRAFVRLFEPHSGMELGRFILNRSYDCIGLLVGILHRSRRDRRWYLRVMTDPIPGNVITKSYGELKRLVPGYLHTFQY